MFSPPVHRHRSTGDSWPIEHWAAAVTYLIWHLKWISPTSPQTQWRKGRFLCVNYQLRCACKVHPLWKISSGIRTSVNHTKSYKSPGVTNSSEPLCLILDSVNWRSWYSEAKEDGFGGVFDQGNRYPVWLCPLSLLHGHPQAMVSHQKETEATGLALIPSKEPGSL